MISQRCPKCLSKKIRRGYRPTPLWSKILFRYNLLCDSCNWEFVGFAVPGTVSAKPTRRTKKAHAAAKKEETDAISDGERSAEPSEENVISLIDLNGQPALDPVIPDKKVKRAKVGNKKS